MKKTPIFYKLNGIAIAATFILTSCNLAASTQAPASATATLAPVSSPVAPTASMPPTAIATATSVPTATATAAPTATSAPTVTSQLNAQLAPSDNANCRKGPGTGYYIVTYLQQGNVYNVIGRNSLNTWWLVQASANVTCWIGDAGATQMGPVNQATIVPVQPLPATPATFVDTYTCNTTLHNLTVVFNWSAVSYVTGYRLFRNGTQITDLPPTTTSFSDTNAPRGVSLVYALEAHNDYGAAAQITVSVPSCD
jgi:hypothetical protein